MERTHIKSSFMGFAHRVAPLQKVFDKECGDAVLNTDVLEFLSGFQKELVGNMMDGACAISQHRRSEDVAAKDLLCHLDTQWKVDPLLMTSNCMESSYQLKIRTDKINLPSSSEPVKKKRRTRGSGNLPKGRPASSKAKKNSNRKSELKRKHDQSIKAIKRKSKVNLKSQVTCPKDTFKNPLPLSNEKPELKAKKQTSIKASAPNKFEFLGNKCKFGACNVDGILQPSTRVPVCKPKPEEEKKPICQNSINIPSVEGKNEVECDVPVWVTLDPETNTLKVVGLRIESAADAVSKSPVVSIRKLKSKVHEQSSNCEFSVKILPFKEKTESEVKVPSKNHFDPETRKLRITGINDCSKQSPETCINIPRSNVDEKMPACKAPFEEKTQPEFKRAKQASIEIPCPNSQVFKIAEKKGKQLISSVKYASDETLEEARHHSVEIPHPNSCVRKISVKRRKQKVCDINGVKVETREEARRKLAIILLRIAGKY